jgi:hypothetical protein
MEIDWKDEISRIRPQRAALALGTLAFVFGLIQGTREGGIGNGLLSAFVYLLSLAVLAIIFFVVVSLVASLIVMLNDFINDFPKLEEYIRRALRWLQDHH